MPSLADSKNIAPSTNYLYSLVIIHNPLAVVMAISKAMIMLAIVAYH